MSEMFEIYTKEVKVGELTYKLRPLSGRFLPKLYAIINKFENMDEKDKTSSAAFKLLDEDSITKLHELLLETFKKSYPNENVEKLEEFVSQNLLQLFEPLMQVNMQTDVITKK